MTKIYAFLSTVSPILAILGILQIALLFLNVKKRRQINFFIFGVLAYASIRPNILGETFGIIGPLYFLVLFKLSKSLAPEFIPDRANVEKARNALVFMFSILLSYWIYITLISSAKGYPFSVWPPIANLGTVGVDCYLIFQIYKHGSIYRLFRPFIAFVTYQALAALISKFIFDYQYCFSFEAGRGWTYSICAPGAIFSSSTRLTGFGGEPSIFATYLCIAIVAVWWPQFKFRIWIPSIVTGTCTWASFISNSTTGVTLVFFALALVIFQRFKIHNGPLLLVCYASTIYYLVNTELISSAVEKIFSDKKETNLGSITDRSLNLSFSDYMNRWETYPFGDLWGYKGIGYTKSINLLSESMMYGPFVILLLISLILGASVLSQNRIKTLSPLLIIFTTCLFLQPTWLNAVWIILIYLITLANLNKDTEKFARIDSVKKPF
jgi:hypothetical protein